MSALTFAEVLRAAQGKTCTRAARECVHALEREADVSAFVSKDMVRDLRKVHRALADAIPQGRLATRVLFANTSGAIVALVELGTGTVGEPRKRLSEERAIMLYGDAFLVLDKWVLKWNRDQIRRVA